MKNKRITIGKEAAQAALDAVNHRIRIHEEALMTVNNEEAEAGLKFLKIAQEVEQVLEDHKRNIHSVAQATANLKAARSSLARY